MGGKVEYDGRLGDREAVSSFSLPNGDGRGWQLYVLPGAVRSYHNLQQEPS